MKIRKHMEILGFKVKDKVTGFTGVVTAVSFDLYGCVQAIVNPGIGKEGKLEDSLWFDISRLVIVKAKQRTMEPPNFDFGPIAEGLKGPAEKPAFYKP